MHVAIPKAQAVTTGVFVGEDLPALETAINAYITALGVAGYWDADIAAVDGGKQFMVTLTPQQPPAGINNEQYPKLVRAFLYEAELPAELAAKRIYRYANDVNIGGNLYVDKIAASSNGRWFANLQIMGTSGPIG